MSQDATGSVDPLDPRGSLGSSDPSGQPESYRGRHAALRSKPEPEAETPWAELVSMLAAGALIATSLLSMGFSFHGAVAHMNRAGVILTALSACMTVCFICSAVSYRRMNRSRSVVLNICLAVVAVLNWCSWQFSTNVAELLDPLF